MNAIKHNSIFKAVQASAYQRSRLSVNKKIDEFQRYFNQFPITGAENPTFLKAPTEDRVVLGGFLFGLVFGITLLGRGLLNASLEKNKYDPK
mmetsp:Transcript_8501/g.12844  ORF Transcript_8501/g.12844 Transcript_8501/m.12844 type:complete len:92 (+) Transcript_8501:28-303(+)